MSELGDGVNVDGGTVVDQGSGANTGADGGDGLLGSGIVDASPTNDDLAGLFTPEEIQAKRDAQATGRAEEERRSKLSDAEREAEDKAKAEEAAKNMVPETYADFTAPDGVTLDPELIAEFVPLAKALGLTQEKAQQLVDLQIAIDRKREERTNEVVKWWADQAAKDKEYGGDKIKESLDIANRAMDKIASPELKQLLQSVGINNHPEFIRMWVRIGKQVMEDSGTPTGGRMGQAEGPRTFNYENTK